MRKGIWVLALASMMVALGCGGGDSNPGTDSVSPSDATDVSDVASDVAPTDALDQNPGDQADDALDVVPDTADSTPDVDTFVPDVEPDTDVVEDVDLVDTQVPDEVGDTVEDVDQTDTTEPPLTYFPSAELGIKIVGPSATGVAQSLGSQVQVAGLVAGQPDSISWATDDGQTGYAQGTPFWLTTPMTLKIGDNGVTVTATKGDEVATDRIVITYNPGFLFGSDLEFRPGAIFVGSTSSVIFRVDMSAYSNFEASTLKLCESTPEGVCVTDIHAMLDNGQVGSSGDEVAEDGIFSWKKSYTPTVAGPICFRAKAVVKAGYQQYTAYTPVQCLEVVPRLTQQTCTDAKTVLTDAMAAYQAQAADPAAAQQAALDYLAASPLVLESGAAADGTGVWVRFSSGFLGALDLSPDGNRGGTLLNTATPPAIDYPELDPALMNAEEIAQNVEELTAPILSAQSEVRLASKRTMELSPFNAEFAANDEAVAIHSTLSNSVCPAYSVEGPHKGTNASLAKFRTMGDFGVVSITSHGDALFKGLTPDARANFDWTTQGSQEVIWTGEEVNCSNFVQTSTTCTGAGTCPTGSECIITEAQETSTTLSGVCVDFKQVDLTQGRIVMGAQTFGVLPSFVKKYKSDGYPNSLVYLGSCRSMWNGTLAMEFYGGGARAIVGYNGYVSSEFAFAKGSALVKEMVEEAAVSGAAMPSQTDEDPANPGTVMRLLGASNLNIANADLINTSFETGDITGWQKTGDGRVISKLGITIPVEGKFMGLISTGLGFTPQVGEIYQGFCIPEDKVKMSFYWKYYSEEFKEFCGSSYQDTFEATLEGDEGLITFVNVTVDSLCPPEECDGCGDDYEGLIQSDVSFDQGDAWNTQWRKAEANVMGLAGQGAATLRFFATDKGDSIYDTVILIDAIVLQ